MRRVIRATIICDTDTVEDAYYEIFTMIGNRNYKSGDWAALFKSDAELVSVYAVGHEPDVLMPTFNGTGTSDQIERAKRGMRDDSGQEDSAH